MSSSISATEYTEFDILGRVTGHKQTTDGEEYATEYTYNLSGALIEETYPSGRVVKNVIDTNGDLNIVQSKKNANFGFHNYAQNFTYNAAGAVTSMQLGNGRWEGTVFNSRLQPTEIKLGAVQGGSDNLKLEYGYGTTANNGNVLNQTITVKRPSQSDLVFDQTYTYDSLNRITSATEMTDQTQNWMQAYTFDRYGNRNFDESETTTLAKNCGSSPNFTVCAADRKIFNPELDPANNRMASGQDYTYDAAGNVITDAEGRTFTYDAENKQVEVENSFSQTVGQYFFDGDGKRIKKIVPLTGEVTVFVYDASGALIGEYSTVVETQDPKVQYLTADHLGTPRINTDQYGQVVSRTDYMPYGEEIIALGGRTSTDKYVTDDVRQGFTGYENDAETGLDYAQARMYAKGLGRFLGSDLVAGRVQNPQSLNRYVYVWNNPINLTDSTGFTVEWEDSEKEKKEGETEAKTNKQRSYEKHLDEMINSKNKKTREKGLKLKATYEKLQKSDIVFHVVNENPSGASSGELTYKGEKGHLYVNLKGDSNVYGALKDIQKLAHEFKHGEQFLDGQFGFIRNENGEWKGYRDDLPDEAEAFIAGFEAQPLGPDQRSGSTGEFLNSIGNAMPFGVNSVVDALDRKGPYKGRSRTQLEMRFVGGEPPPHVYAIPKK